MKKAPHRDPLTPDQQALALSAEGWLMQEVVIVPGYIRKAVGDDVLLQEARFAVCKAAHDFDAVSFPGVPFGAFARIGVRKHLLGTAQRMFLKFRTASGAAREPADHRREYPGEAHPALSLWCDEGYRRQRRCLDWRSRVLLYLRAAEGWSLEEVGAVLGVTRERVRQLEDRAIAKLAAYRSRERMTRQLAGLAAV